MQLNPKIKDILRNAQDGKPISKSEAVILLDCPENSLESAVLRATANTISRQKFDNNGLLLGQIGIDMKPCEGDCKFCFFAQSHTTIKPAVLPLEEIITRCERFSTGGAGGIFLMTMHHFGFEWFRDLCAELRKRIPEDLEILANVGDITVSQLKEIRDTGVTGAYHVCRLREGIDSCMKPSERLATIERIIEAGLDWYTMCEPIGPEHSPEELAEQIWVGVELPCRQHGAMQRFPVPGSPLYGYGRISLSRLSQIVAVIALATIAKENIKSIAVNVSNLVGLFSGANAFFPEAGEPELQEVSGDNSNRKDGFTTALWRQSNEITTADCRKMMESGGFSGLMTPTGQPARRFHASNSNSIET